MKKIIIAVLLIIALLITFGIIYINKVYIPVKVKGRLLKTLEASLGYNVGIEKLSLSLAKGIVAQDIIIYDKLKDKENTLLFIKEIHFIPLILPIIKEKKVIIPAVYVESPNFYIRYQKDNTFNFSKLLSIKPQAKQNNKFLFLLYKINILNAKCLFEDEHFSPKFSKTIEDLDIRANIQPWAKVVFSAKARLSEPAVKLSIKGDYDLLSKEANAKLNIKNFSIPEFKPYLAGLPVNIESANIDEAGLNLKFEGDMFSLDGTINARDISLKKEGYALKADIDIEPELKFSLEKKELDYEVGVKILKAGLNGLPYIEKIDNISGSLNLAKDKLSTENIELDALGSSFMLKARLEKFIEPYLKINLTSTQLNLEKLFLIFPRPQNLSLSGVSAINLDIEGNFKNPPLDIKANFDVSSAKLQTAFLKEPLSNINGKLDLTLNSLNWQGLSFNYSNTAYASSGDLVDFKAPQINFRLASKDLNLSSDLKIADKIIKINKADAKFINSTAYVDGSVDIRDAANPVLGLAAKINIDVADTLGVIPEKTKENIQKMKLQGKLDITATVSGGIKDYRNMDVAIRASSDMLSLYGFKFNNLTFDLNQRSGLLKISPFSAFGYSGAIRLEVDSDLRQEPPAYALKLSAENISLAQLKMDTGLKDKDIAGTLSIDANLYGDFKDINNLKGASRLSVTEGKLWELDLLKGLGDLVLISDYGKIVFQEASGTFGIENKEIYTEDLRLSSEQLKLDCKGKVNFDGTLDLTVYNEVNQNLIKDSTDIRKFVSAVLGEIGSAIVVKITGKIQKPKYSVVPVALDLMKSIKDFLLGK